MSDHTRRSTRSSTMASKDDKSLTDGSKPETVSPPTIISMDVLYKTMTDLSINLKELKVELKSEIKSSTDTHQEQIKDLEDRLTKSHSTKSKEISEDMDSKFAAQTDIISKLDQANKQLQDELAIAKTTLTSQSYKLSIVEQQIEDLTTKVNQVDSEAIDILNMEINEAKRVAREALVLANSVEAHGRRWSVRILGIPAPPKEGEDIKQVVINFLTTRLNINHMTSQDIDCCHRLGDINKDGQQMILTRFFARDLVDIILRRKKNLKGSGLVCLEDSTWLNRALMKSLNARKDVHSSWIA